MRLKGRTRSMQRKDYYEVPLGAYAFERSASEEDIKPEERVRQWCVQELIRAYGYSITDITFEHRVRYGSSQRRIDILILKDDKPFIVVECKRQEFKKNTKGLEQAINYAGAESIKAEYAVYTNGTDWMVQRCIDGRWAPIEDIPTNLHGEAEFTVDLLYRDLTDAAPLLHKLVGQLDAKATHRYFEAMQRFFYGSNLLTESGDRKLRWALDNLLRSILHFESLDGYMQGKFLEAYSNLLDYGQRVGAGWITNPPYGTDHPFRQTALYQLDILEFLENSASKAVGLDYYFLDLIAVLFGYSHGLIHYKKRKFPELPSEIQESMRSLLNYCFKLELNHRVPTRSDKLTHQDIAHACDYGWDSSRFSLST
jgi:hypothetical protein